MRNIFRKRKSLELTSEEKVSQSKEKVENALSMFTKIYTELEEVNKTLETVITQDTEKITAIEKNINSANKELEGNKVLQNKLKQFIKGE